MEVSSSDDMAVRNQGPPATSKERSYQRHTKGVVHIYVCVANGENADSSNGTTTPGTYSVHDTEGKVRRETLIEHKKLQQTEPCYDLRGP